MDLIFGLNEKATEGEHAARIVAVENVGVVRGQFGPTEMVKVVFEMTDQPDSNGDFAKVNMQYALKLSKESKFGKLLDDMGWSRNGKEFNLQWLVGETLHVIIQHNRDGKFANVVNAVRDPAIVREYRRPCPWTGCTEFVNPHDDAEVKSGRCYLHCYLKAAVPIAESVTECPTECFTCEHDDCTNNPVAGSRFCYRHGGQS